jgi:hypothetical protein
MGLKHAVVSLALIAGLFSSASISAQAPRQLPPLQYTCPHHPEVLLDHPGTCHLCQMKLEPTRIDTELNYSCPNHPVVITQQTGVCPIDRRELVPVVVTLHWTCKQNPDEKLIDPGKCADGSQRQMVRQIRAHGDHNPRHGGTFFMAQDQWHHLEGTYPQAGLFRAFFYDNYTQPMMARNFTGRIVTREEFDYAAKVNKEIESFPLRLSKDGQTLEAALKNVPAPSAAAPVQMTMKVRLTQDGPEQSFGFAFVEYSKEPPVSAPKPAAPTSAPAATTASAGATAGKPMPEAPPPVVQAPPVPSITNCEPNLARTDTLLLSDALPRNAGALLNLLGMCSAEVQKLVEGSQFGYVYQPTMLGKDIALALEAHINELPESRRGQASQAIRRTVLAAWELDMFGDMGNRERITEAYNHFAAAIAAVKSAYAPKP